MKNDGRWTKDEGRGMKDEGRRMKDAKSTRPSSIILHLSSLILLPSSLLSLLLALALICACGSDNAFTGEDHGNVSASTSGTVLVEAEHPVGWGKADCFQCHFLENIHKTDRSGTGLNLEAIRTLTRTDGLDSCPVCHGTNGVN